MTTYTPERFVEEVANRYATLLRARFPEAKVRLDDTGGAIGQALKNPRLFRVVRDFDQTQLPFYIDGYVRDKGEIDGDLLVESVVNALSQKIEEVVEPELRSERERSFKDIGAGEIWIVHKPFSVPLIPVGAFVHAVATNDIAIYGHAWQEGGKSIFEFRTNWAVARHGEIRKEAVEV